MKAKNVHSGKPSSKRKAAAAAALVVLAAALLSVSLAVARSRICKVVFYGVADEVAAPVKKALAEAGGSRVKFYSMDDSVPLSKRAAMRADLVFLWNGWTARSLARFMKEIPAECFEEIPRAIARSVDMDGKKYALPVLLDHFEMAYYRTWRMEAGLEIPATLSGLDSYAVRVKPWAQFPVFCAGLDDAQLLGFVSCMAESMYGAKKYGDMSRDLRASFDGSEKFTTDFTDVLDRIISMQESGAIHPGWAVSSDGDLQALMKSHQLGAICMALSNHRQKEFLYIKYYEAAPFPIGDTSIPHALIAPELCAMRAREKPLALSLLSALSGVQAQSDISNETRLAPVSARAEAHDRQADDARFWAASYEGGPLPSIGEACAASGAQRHSLAEKIRSYLKS